MLNNVLKNTFIKFLLAGVINTLFSYCLFAVLMFCINIKELVVTLNYIIAIFFNYMMSSRFVFQNKKVGIIQIARFYIVYFITYPLNLLHLYVTVDIWHWNVYLSQFVTLLYMPVISFILQKKLVFNEIEKES